MQWAQQLLNRKEGDGRTTGHHPLWVISLLSVRVSLDSKSRGVLSAHLTEVAIASGLAFELASTSFLDLLQ